MAPKKSEVLQGTLDLMILKTLHALGPQHGFGIARRIEQLSESVLQLNEGTVYTSLLRLQQQGWIASEWGTSENNRKARFYSITKRGLKQLTLETENWQRISGVIGRVLGTRKQNQDRLTCSPPSASSQQNSAASSTNPRQPSPRRRAANSPQPPHRALPPPGHVPAGSSIRRSPPVRQLHAVATAPPRATHLPLPHNPATRSPFRRTPAPPQPNPNPRRHNIARPGHRCQHRHLHHRQKSSLRQPPRQRPTPTPHALLGHRPRSEGSSRLGRRLLHARQAASSAPPSPIPSSKSYARKPMPFKTSSPSKTSR